MSNGSMLIRRKKKAYPIPLLVKQRRESRARQSQTLLSRSRNFMIFLGILFSTVLMGALVFGAYLYASITDDLPAVEKIPAFLDPVNGSFSEPTRFYDRSGQHVIYTLENPGVSRSYYSIDPSDPAHFSPQLIQVVVALVEPGFWSSTGFSWKQLTHGQPLTIAERLAADLLLNSEHAGLRKALRMRLLAAQMVAEYGRGQVLEWYLNSAYFGHLAYGANQAAQLYFDESAQDLNLAESALLVSLLFTPSLNPLDAPQAAIERKNETLDSLEESGLFAESDIENARAVNLVFASRSDSAGPDAFIEYVLRQISDLLEPHQIERDGLHVITTMDAGLQEQLICTIEAQLSRLEDPQAGTLSLPESCQAAYLLPTIRHEALFSGSDIAASGQLLSNAVILNPATAEILAWSGERSSAGAVEARVQYQAGSLLTPFVAAAAFARGFSPASLVWDVPSPSPSISEDAGMLAVENRDGIFHGPMHLRSALANDYLTPVVRLAETIGYENVWLLARTLGLQNLDRDQIAEDLASGAAPASPLQIAQAYSTFANRGSQAGIAAGENGVLQPLAFLRIEDRYGQVLYQHTVNSRALLAPGLAYLVHDVLSDSLARRPSLGHPNALEIGRPAGAKVGWVSGGNQVWTVGYTPQVLSVVWMGLAAEDNPSPGVELSPDMAAGIWHALMQYTAQGQEVQDWQAPPDVVQRTVCSPSGQLPTNDCPSQVSELFLMGSEPVVTDSLYKTYAINRETGKLATVFTPLERVEEKTFFIPPPAYQEWALANGYPQPPSDYDLIQEQKPLPDVEISDPGPFSYVRGTVRILGSAGGADFLAYRLQVGQGLNPDAWIQIGDQSEGPVLRGLLAEWDTSGLDGLYVIRLTVQRADNRLESHAIQVAVDNTAPAAAITFPEEGRAFEYQPGERILFLAEGLDSIGLSGMLWYLDGEKIGENSQPPFFQQWEMVDGVHELQVEAIDLAGNRSRSQAVTFSVSAP